MNQDDITNDTHEQQHHLQQQQSNIRTFIGIGNSEREMQPLIFDNKVCVYTYLQ